MHPFVHILLIAILMIVLIILSVLAFAIIRYIIFVLFAIADIDKWRSELEPGTEVLVIERNLFYRRLTITYISGSLVQLTTPDGNLSGHHISTIYPISRNHGTTK